MKIIKLLLLVLCIATLQQVEAQTNVKDSVRIVEYLPVIQTDAALWIQRYQKDIDRYTQENRELKNLDCDVLIFGSSSINMWNTIYEDLAPMKVIRRSYGGAAIRDMLYNYDVIARGYNPKRIVLYVENDLGGSNDVSIGKLYELFKIFTLRIKRDYPDVPFYIMSMKPSPMKKYHLNNQKVINSLIESIANEISGVRYIDISKAMFDGKGEIRTDIFLEDNLHMNAKGYKVWTGIIKPILIEGL